MGLVRFKKMSAAEYAAAVKDTDTLYFVSVTAGDARVTGYKMYLGSSPIVTSE